MADSIGIGWRPSSLSGWGVYGTNLLIQLLRQGRNPVLTQAPYRLDVDAETEKLIAPAVQRQRHLDELLKKIGVLEFDFPVLHALRNDFFPPLDEQIAKGSANLGVIFFEDTAISAEGLARARTYDRIVTGSTWNQEIANARGLHHVVTVFQGVDTSLFHPRERATRFKDRFVVFSGGKLEYRKGQDVVIAAFRIFREKHPEALLMLAWGNQWPAIMPTIANSPFVEGAPEVTGEGSFALSPWLQANGLPANSFADLGMIPNRAMPEYLAAADVALFPNRCEPGTNLVAMEAMAAGIPSILAVNTGQRDIAAEGACYRLARQSPVRPYAPYAGTEGWGEPDLDEVLSALEQAHGKNEERRTIGAKGAEFMQKFDWSAQVAGLVREVDALTV